MTLNKGVRKGGDVVVFIRSKNMDWDQWNLTGDERQKQWPEWLPLKKLKSRKAGRSILLEMSIEWLNSRSTGRAIIRELPSKIETTVRSHYIIWDRYNMDWWEKSTYDIIVLLICISDYARKHRQVLPITYGFLIIKFAELQHSRKT